MPADSSCLARAYPAVISFCLRERPGMAKKIECIQQELNLKTWGDRRKGAGRKPKGRRPGLPHDPRDRLPKHCPAHVTLRVGPDIWNLRGSLLMQEIRCVFWRMRGIAGMRLTQFSIQHNHIHMIVEAESHQSLSVGMRVLCIRLATRINRVMGRSGPMFPDRFHLHILRSPREVEHAIRYIRDNSRIHARREGRSWRQAVDPCTGGPCVEQFPAENRCLVVEPQTWLLRRAWRLPPLPSKPVVLSPEPQAFPWLDGAEEPGRAENLELALDAA